MKNNYFISSAILLIAGSLLIGCNNNKEKVEEAKQDVKQANQDLKDAQAKYDKEWAQFKIDAEKKINDNETTIEKLKSEIKSTNAKLKATYEKEVTVLEQKNIELKKKINEFKYDGIDKWEEFKQGFNNEVDAVGKSLTDFFTKKN
jgi:chromosome segregation ATPase